MLEEVFRDEWGRVLASLVGFLGDFDLLPVPEAIMDEFDDTVIKDERLELIFTCCHPALPLEGQVALTLRASGAWRPPRSPGPSWSPRRPGTSAPLTTSRSSSTRR